METLFYLHLCLLSHSPFWFPRICFLHLTVIETLHATRLVIDTNMAYRRLLLLLLTTSDNDHWGILLLWSEKQWKLWNAELEDFSFMIVVPPCWVSVHHYLTLRSFMSPLENPHTMIPLPAVKKMTHDLLSILFSPYLFDHHQLHTVTGLQRVYYPRHEPP